MAIEDVFSIEGRGTVATGRIERGVVKVGRRSARSSASRTSRGRSICTGVEMFNKTLDQRTGGRQRRLPAARRQARRDRARPGAGQAGFDHAAHPVRGRGLRPVEGGRWATHAVLQRLPPAVLLPDDRRDRHGQSARRRRDVHARRQRQARRSNCNRRSRWTRTSVSPSARAAARSGSGVVTKILK